MTAARPAPEHGGGAAPRGTWKGLPRRHPAAVTASRIREHLARYQIHGTEDRGLLAAAADRLDATARQEPDR